MLAGNFCSLALEIFESFRFEFPESLDLSEFLKSSSESGDKPDDAADAVPMEVDGEEASVKPADCQYILHAVLVSSIE